MFFFAWGIFWACYWAFSLIYGLAKSWDQQQLAFHLAMTLTTLILMGVIYLKYILPDTIIVKHSQNKYVPEHVKDWKEYKW
jgi:succinate-acetate transporter protein